ncbi:hypothetical protein BLOT_013493 [Blomia tropicalis]|nr:hypothetical protein BLOT_013493 [Blomia tropicalis]
MVCDLKQFEHVISVAYSSKSTIYLAILEFIRSRVNQTPLGEHIMVPTEVNQIVPKMDSYQQLNLIWLILDRNPTLSDDLWLKLAELSGEVISCDDYESCFLWRKEFGSVTIFPSLLGRRAYRSSLPPKERLHDGLYHVHDLIKANLPLFSEYEYLPTFEQLIAKNVKMDSPLMKLDTTKLKGQKSNKAFNNLEFANFFKHFIETNLDHSTILLEELSDCLYWVIDREVPPAFSTIATMKRDYSIYRLVRFMICGNEMHDVCLVINTLTKEQFDEFSSNLLPEDRYALDDGYLSLGMSKTMDLYASDYNPFKSSWQDVFYHDDAGYNPKVMDSAHELMKYEELKDPLQRVIFKDPCFRNLLKRQVEEWYNTDIKDDEGKLRIKGVWDGSVQLKVDPTIFWDRYGSMEYRYFTPKGSYA